MLRERPEDASRSVNGRKKLDEFYRTYNAASFNAVMKVAFLRGYLHVMMVQGAENSEEVLAALERQFLSRF